MKHGGIANGFFYYCSQRTIFLALEMVIQTWKLFHQLFSFAVEQFCSSLLLECP